MKRLILASAMMIAGFCGHAAHAAAPAECFASSSAVFSAHPNAAHASYVAHGKGSSGSGRCWFADAFKAQAKANAGPTPGSETPAARTPAPRHASAKAPTAQLHGAPAPQSHTTAISPARQFPVMAMESGPRPRTTAVAPAPLAFPAQAPAGVQIAVNGRKWGRPSSVDESPADFESRFSASGYVAPK